MPVHYFRLFLFYVWYIQHLRSGMVRAESCILGYFEGRVFEVAPQTDFHLLSPIQLLDDVLTFFRIWRRDLVTAIETSEHVKRALCDINDKRLVVRLLGRERSICFTSEGMYFLMAANMAA